MTPVEKLSPNNFLSVCDVAMDILEKLQMTEEDAIFIKIVRSIIRFPSLLPANSLNLMYDYGNYRSRALKYLKESKYIENYEFIKEGGSSFDTKVKVYLDRKIFKRFYNRLSRVYEKRVVGPSRQEAEDKKRAERITTTAESSSPSNFSGKEIFIIHGHDEELKNEIADTIKGLSLRPIILHEQANKGRTIIEKLEDESRKVGFAVALLTPDDVYIEQVTQTVSRRARQNVILELGYFMGLLGRKRVCAIYNKIEFPSDMAGILYIPYDKEGNWKLGLAREIEAAGVQIEKPNKL